MQLLDMPAAAPADGVMSRTRHSARAWPLALGALGVVALAIGFVALVRSPIVLAGDDAMYVILARSLATGQGYRSLNLPGAPAATHFPPGYPALLALLWRVGPQFPDNLALFKMVNAVCLAIIVMCSATLVRRTLRNDAWAIGVGLVVAVSVPVLILGNMLLSELLFLALLIPLLSALEDFTSAPNHLSRRDAWRPAVLGLAIGLCMLVRTHAIVLVPATALMLAYRRRWRDAAVLSAVALCCLLPWQLWSARHGNVLPVPLRGEYDSYSGWWIRGYRALGPRMIPMTLRRTVAESAEMFAVLFSPVRSSAGHVVAIVSLAGLAITGIAVERRRLSVTLLFLAGYFAIVVLWPFQPTRFVWGVWPLVLLLLAAGIRQVLTALRSGTTHLVVRRGLAVAGSVAALWILAGYSAYEVRAIRGRWWRSIPRDNAARVVPAVRWTLANTAPTDLIAAEDDGALFLYTGRHTLPVRTFTAEQYLTDLSPRVDAEQGLVPLLAAYPVTLVVVGTQKTFAAAQWVASQSPPLVSFREQFVGGAAFTVLPR